MEFGRYRLITLVGAGAHGTVYRATLSGDSSAVALRLLSARLLDDPGFIGRLDELAGTLAALRHPALNPVLDWGTEAGQPFLVTTLEPGTPLSRANPLVLKLTDRVALVAEAAEALGAVHEIGLVHGDLRPANMALREGGRIGITDVALARWLGAEVPLAYAEPEFAGDAPPDPLSDLYALGVLLYRLLTGETPLVGATFEETVALRRGAFPAAPSSLRPEIPRALDLVALRLLSPDRTSRFQSADAVVEALAPFAGGFRPIGLSPLEPNGHRKPVVVGARTGTPVARLSGRLARGPRPPWLATSLTALALATLGVATIVGAGHAAGRTQPVRFFPRAASQAAGSPAAPAVSPTIPVVAALPPPVVVTATVNGSVVLSRTISGTQGTSLTVYSTLPVSGVAGSPPPSGTLSSTVRSSLPLSPTIAPPPPVQSNPDAMLFVVSKRQGVPESYAPADLVTIDGLVKAMKPNLRLRRAVFDAFRRMTEAMRTAGLEPAIADGYRSPADQKERFTKLVSQHGQTGAERLSAKPGFDEHQLGTVIDFVAATQGFAVDDRFDESAEGKWLLANAAKYGFIQSQPVGKDAVLGFKPQPGQYRYIGELAFDVASRRQTLEEYVGARR
ncbi:MAG: D-alanyl-D-alanine carboxypeptidase family protein [Dehalococcoidia bacterium]